MVTGSWSKIWIYLFCQGITIAGTLTKRQVIPDAEPTELPDVEPTEAPKYEGVANRVPSTGRRAGSGQHYPRVVGVYRLQASLFSETEHIPTTVDPDIDVYDQQDPTDPPPESTQSSPVDAELSVPPQTADAPIVATTTPQNRRGSTLSKVRQSHQAQKIHSTRSSRPVLPKSRTIYAMLTGSSRPILSKLGGNTLNVKTRPATKVAPRVGKNTTRRVIKTTTRRVIKTTQPPTQATRTPETPPPTEEPPDPIPTEEPDPPPEPTPASETEPPVLIPAVKTESPTQVVRQSGLPRRPKPAPPGRAAKQARKAPTGRQTVAVKQAPIATSQRKTKPKHKTVSTVATVQPTTAALLLDTEGEPLEIEPLEIEPPEGL